MFQCVYPIVYTSSVQIILIVNPKWNQSNTEISECMQNVANVNQQNVRWMCSPFSFSHNEALRKCSINYPCLCLLYKYIPHIHSLFGLCCIQSVLPFWLLFCIILIKLHIVTLFFFFYLCLPSCNYPWHQTTITVPKTQGRHKLSWNISGLSVASILLPKTCGLHMKLLFPE